MSIFPVILSGGSGSRLWPVSRENDPKQFQPLTGDSSMFRQSLERVRPYAAPLIVCNEAHRFIVGEELRQAEIEPDSILIEPLARNTAPAAGAAAAFLSERHGAEAMMLLMPSDHFIADPEQFRAIIARGLPAANDGALVTFGITPDHPHTGYGYIRQGSDLDGKGEVWRVERFVEKPDLDRAKAMLAEGGHTWNSGIFLFTAGAFLAELDRLAPAMAQACRAAVAERRGDLFFQRLDRDCFAKAANISIDYAVMEQTDKAVVVPVPVAVGWSDIGSWSSLWQSAPRDAAGNSQRGAVMAVETQNSVLHSLDGRMIAALGVEDMVVVATRDAVLVADKKMDQRVREFVERLKDEGHPAALDHVRVNRPWGWYETLEEGPAFKVKRLQVDPGKKLSLQKHEKRAEHWVVVSGIATVTKGEDVFDLPPGHSTFIPPTTLHRLENRAKEPVQIIEVQTGNYFGEDDIIRVEDDFGRVAS